MAASATPTKADPKPLGAATNLSTSTTNGGTVIYTAATGERGTKVESITVVNTTTTPATITVNYRDVPNTFGAGANTLYKLAAAALIPGDGYPVVLELGTYFAATAELRAFAGTATALDVIASGIELAS